MLYDNSQGPGQWISSLGDRISQLRSLTGAVGKITDEEDLEERLEKYENKLCELGEGEVRRKNEKDLKRGAYTEVFENYMEDVYIPALGMVEELDPKTVKETVVLPYEIFEKMCSMDGIDIKAIDEYERKLEELFEEDPLISEYEKKHDENIDFFL